MTAAILKEININIFFLNIFEWEFLGEANLKEDQLKFLGESEFVCLFCHPVVKALGEEGLKEGRVIDESLSCHPFSS